MHKSFPFQINQYGHIQEADDDKHLRDMMEQILFTIPGERVNRPEFGCGVQLLVFGSIQAEMLSVKQSMIQIELQKYLGHLMQLQVVNITAHETQLDIFIRYLPFVGDQAKEVVFTR
ncbi:GPW/gp25 family protein [uncultured Shewanella sp.]|uniref:GPW/gp25 family protein n=1 Tax=uncultured Shewanella sp. TaxID=173975 RepID=UPI00260775D0|nr:GPW/gp25 family protein [uncultured Shewanella sp.]